MRGKIEEQKRNETHENKKYIGRYKSSYLNNNIKCEWIKQDNLKTEIVKRDFLKFPIQVYTVYRIHTLGSKIQID